MKNCLLQLPIHARAVMLAGDDRGLFLPDKFQKGETEGQTRMLRCNGIEVGRHNRIIGG